MIYFNPDNSNNQAEVLNDPAFQTLQSFFKDKSQPIVCDIDVVGQGINDKGQLVVGAKVDFGLPLKTEYLSHEMCHFAEREIDKLALRPRFGWGFSMGKYWEIGSKSGYEMQNDKDVRREQRVFAYQLSVMKYHGMEVDPYDLVYSSTFLGGWCYYQPFETPIYGCEKKDNPRVKKLCEDTLLMSQGDYNYEAFVSEWNKRIDFLRNVTNTKGYLHV